MRNLEFNINKSWGLYKRLFQKEQFVLKPGCGLRMGLLEFHIERFNTGIVSEKGSRPQQEDSYAVVQDLCLDSMAQHNISYYAVFDGHGGPECAHFLRGHLHIELRKELEQRFEAVKQG